MKRFQTLPVLFMLGAHLSHAQPPDCDLVIEPKWQDLEINQDKSEKFGSKWILVGSFTFKKKSRDAVDLEKIILQWHGDQIEHIMASLYRKKPDKDFLPIESFLICDGSWQKNKQRLVLRFDSTQALGQLDVFYLVLSIPHSLEDKLSAGYFSIQKDCLPEKFKECVSANEILAMPRHIFQKPEISIH